MLKLLTNAQVFAPEDLDVRHVRVGAGRILDVVGCLPVFNEQGEMLHMDIGRPQSLATTMADLPAGGIKLDAILPAFTSNVADILRLHDRGRIRPGASADMVVLTESGAISDVMAGGVWHVRDAKQRVFGQFENSDQK